MTQPIPPAPGLPPINFQVHIAPPGPDGKAHPVLVVQSGAMQIMCQMDSAGARQIGGAIAEGLMRAADEADRQSSGIVIPTPGFVIPQPSSGARPRPSNGSGGL